jgi:hypothetical protein
MAPDTIGTQLALVNIGVTREAICVLSRKSHSFMAGCTVERFVSPRKREARRCMVEQRILPHLPGISHMATLAVQPYRPMGGLLRKDTGSAEYEEAYDVGAPTHSSPAVYGMTRTWMKLVYSERIPCFQHVPRDGTRSSEPSCEHRSTGMSSACHGQTRATTNRVLCDSVCRS